MKSRHICTCTYIYIRCAALDIIIHDIFEPLFKDLQYMRQIDMYTGPVAC